MSSTAWCAVTVWSRSPGFATAGGVSWLRDRWPVASFASFARPVCRLVLLLLLLLVLLLLCLLVFDVCNLRGRGCVKQCVQALKSATGGRAWYKFVLERVQEACPGNIVEDFFMLQWIQPSLSPITFQKIRIGSDRFLGILNVFLHQGNHHHAISILIRRNLGYLLWKEVEVL